MPTGWRLWQLQGSHLSPLFPMAAPGPWEPGWNTARCMRGAHDGPAPGADLRLRVVCGAEPR